jgi:hypothetical protein
LKFSLSFIGAAGFLGGAMIQTARRELPRSLRDVLVDEFLPEILHDLNNECAVLEGAATLLRAESQQSAKVIERAKAVGRAGEGCARVAWLGNAVAAALGSPLALQEREDGFDVFCGILAATIERRGGKLAWDRGTLAWAEDPMAICWFSTLARIFAGPQPGLVEIRRDGGSGAAWRVLVEGGSPQEGFAEAAALAEPVLRARVVASEGIRRWLCVGCELPVDA